MSDSLKILVVDDHAEIEEQNARQIERAISETNGDAQVLRLNRARVKELIDVIERIDPSAEDSDWSRLLCELKEFEQYDILFLDYQLREFQDHPWLTAEDLAGVIRAFGGVRQVVIVNRYHEVDFDLGMIGWGTTSADLHVNGRVLSNTGLWLLPDAGDQGIDISRFRPWYWPILGRSVQDTKKCRSELEGLDLESTCILTYLGLDARRSATLTHSALGALNPLSKSPEDTTFAEFLLNGCTGVDEGVRRFLWSHIEEKEFKPAACRVIVSELRRWLTFQVLGPQDVLIDPPHLAQRMPWLLDGPIGDLAIWNITVALDELRGFRTDMVARYRHIAKEHWFSRVVLWAREIQADEAIDDAFRSFVADNSSDAAFQEDFSRFAPANTSVEFTAAFSSIWANRFISSAALDDAAIVYAPKVRVI